MPPPPVGGKGEVSHGLELLGLPSPEDNAKESGVTFAGLGATVVRGDLD